MYDVGKKHTFAGFATFAVNKSDGGCSADRGCMMYDVSQKAHLCVLCDLCGEYFMEDGW